MKTSRHPALAIVSGLLALGLSAACAQEIHDRVNAHDLRIRKAREAAFIGGNVSRVKDPRTRSPQKQSILADSILLGDGRHWTIVPKGSVLCMPKALENHILKNGEGEILTWRQFLARNRSWLTVSEVDMDTAAGRTPIPKERLEAMEKTGLVVVAVHRGGAISVRRKPEAKDKPKSEAQPGPTAQLER